MIDEVLHQIIDDVEVLRRKLFFLEGMLCCALDSCEDKLDSDCSTDREI